MVGAHDPKLLARALEWNVRIAQNDQVQVRVVPVGVGHLVPTGDVFRRLQLAAVVEDASGRMVGYEERSFRRDWDEHADSLRQRRPERFDGDTRLGAEGSTLEIACSGPPVRVRVMLTYDRGSFGRGDELGTFESIVVVDEIRELEAHAR